MKTVQVRECCMADIDDVARLWHESALSTGLESDVVSDVADYRDRLDAEWKRAWRVHVAYDEPGIVGFLAFEPEKFWLRQLFVDPVKKRSGIGSILLGVARREMPVGFWLRTHCENLAARRFYEGQGLHNIGEGRHETWPIMVVRYQWSSERS